MVVLHRVMPELWLCAVLHWDGGELSRARKITRDHLRYLVLAKSR